MNVTSFGLVLIYVIFLLFAYKRLQFFLNGLKESEYRNARFRQWMSKKHAYDKFAPLGLGALAALWAYVPDFVAVFGTFFVMSLAVYFVKDQRDTPDAKIIETARDQRIFYVAFALIALLASWPWWLFQPPHNTLPWPWIVNVFSVPFIMLRVNLVMMPLDNTILRKNRKDLMDKLDDYDPVVVGVTGSYDKTAVKHVLSYILASQGAVLMVPDGVQTIAGVTESLSKLIDKKHKFVVVEMCALEPGYVTAFCNLVRPKYGVISSIGHAHYDRYDSIDMLARSNFELVYGVNQHPDGKIVIHERTLRFSPARMIKGANRQFITVCGESPEKDRSKQVDLNYMEPGDTEILSMDQVGHTLETNILYQGRTYRIRPVTRDSLMAKCCAVAAVAALEMGVDIDSIQRVIERLPRLPKVKQEPKASEQERS